MNWVDWVILVVLGFSALVGIKRGFVKEALSLSTWVMAIVVAVILNERLSLYLMEYIANEKLRYLVAFVLLFVATLLLGALASSLMTQIIKVAGLKDTDRLLGMAFGLARGVVLMVALLLVFREVAPDETEDALEESLLGPHLQVVEEWVRELLTDVVDKGGVDIDDIKIDPTDIIQ